MSDMPERHAKIAARFPLTLEALRQSEGPIASDGGSTAYYQIPDHVTDCLDLIEHLGLGFGLGNAFKALFRLGRKVGTDRAYDLRKVIFFAQRELDKLETGA